MFLRYAFLVFLAALSVTGVVVRWKKLKVRSLTVARRAGELKSQGYAEAGVR